MENNLPPSPEDNIVSQHGFTMKPKSNKKIWFLVILGFMLIAAGTFFLWKQFYIPIGPGSVDLKKYQDTTTDEFADWKTYRNEEYGFEIKIPSDWIVKKVGSGLYLISSELERWNDYCSKETMPADCYTEGSAFNIAFQNSSTLPGARGEIKQQNINGINYSTYIDSGLVEHYYLETNKDNRIYSFEAVADETTLKKILSTFKFISTSTETVTWDSQNVGDFTGYYVKKEKDFGDELFGVSVCDVLKVKSGDAALIKYYKDMVNRGNTINDIDDDGDLLLNINPGNLSEQDQNKIFNSNQDNQVTLTMKKKIEEGKGAAPCFSFLEIVDVK